MNRLIIAAIVAVAATVAVAAGKPLAISLSPASTTVTEGQSSTFALGKSGGGKPSLVRITTSDGSWSGTAYGGSAFTVPTKDDAVVNGTRVVTITATAGTGATAKATITILDNDVPPPPPPPQTCPDGTVISAGAVCPPPTQTCPDGTIISAQIQCPPPPPPTGGRLPTYHDTVQALQPCIGRYIPDALIVGTRYKVVGMWISAPIGTASMPLGTPADGVIIVPEVDDGVHRGDGWFALWVPFECVALAS